MVRAGQIMRTEQERQPSWSHSPVGLVLLTAIALFVLWMLLDTLWVKVPGSKDLLRACEVPGLMVALVAVLITHGLVQRERPLTFLLTTLASLALAFVLVLFVGIPFHFAIGGDL